MEREGVMVNVVYLTETRATWRTGFSAKLQRIVFMMLTGKKRPILIVDWTVPWAVQMGNVSKHQSVSSYDSFLIASVI